MISRPTDQPIDCHAVGDRAQPAGERLRLAELCDFLHRLDEDVLAQLLCLAIVAEPAQSDCHDVALEALEQISEGLAIAALCSDHQLDELGVIGIQSAGSHGKGSDLLQIQVQTHLGA